VNSSPPSRAIVSTVRVIWPMRPAAVISTLSPVAWPWTSLISLK